MSDAHCQFCNSSLWGASVHWCAESYAANQVARLCARLNAAWVNRETAYQPADPQHYRGDWDWWPTKDGERNE